MSRGRGMRQSRSRFQPQRHGAEIDPQHRAFPGRARKTRADAHALADQLEQGSESLVEGTGL
jgi:hypothetical protein